MTDSLSHARRAKISADEWCKRMRQDGSHQYTRTEWYKALKALEAEAKIGAGSTSPAGGSGGAVTPPPAPAHPDMVPLGWGRALAALEEIGAGEAIPPQVPAPVHLYESLIFCAQEPEKVLRAPLKYAAVLSADHAYRDESAASISAFRAQDRRVLAWSDCRPTPGGTPASEAIQLSRDYNLDGVVGQAESATEFAHAYNAGLRVMVGNLSALEPRQKTLIADGEVVFLQEVYRNEDAGLVPNFENLPVQVCVGLYPGAAGYVPLSWYKQNGFFPPGASVYYGAGISEQDWAEL